MYCITRLPKSFLDNRWLLHILIYIYEWASKFNNNKSRSVAYAGIYELIVGYELMVHSPYIAHKRYCRNDLDRRNKAI